MLARWPGAAGPVARLPSGHINETWQTDAHILQRINDHVFVAPTALMRNLGRAIAHDAALTGRRLLVAPLANAEGDAWSVDADGGIWRLFPRLPSRSFNVLPEHLLGAAGGAFGTFLARFATFDAGSLETAIDGFHDLPAPSRASMHCRRARRKRRPPPSITCANACPRRGRRRRAMPSTATAR